MNRFVTIFFLTATLPSSLVLADILVINNQGNTPLPLEQTTSLPTPVQETEISMHAEQVEIREERHQYLIVKSSFVMKSHSDHVQTKTVAFPVEHPHYGEFVHQHFNATVDTKPVKTTLRMNVKKGWANLLYWKPDYGKHAYAGYVTWPISWAPRQTRTIVCTYKMGEPQVFRSALVKGWRLRYITRTGALWKGNIGRADISVAFKPESHPHALLNVWSERLKDRPGAVFRYSYPGHAHWDSKTKVKWHFEDWNPKHNLVIENLAWIGLTKTYHFPLPYPYRANTQLYTDDLLEDLVNRELKPWQHIFPDQVKNLDRKKLKAVIAECLSQEILARHGEAFSLGYLREAQPAPLGVASLPSRSGHCYGKWHNYFMGYRYHGGWYRPDPNKSSTEIAQGFNPIERENRIFLTKYFAQEN